jgi:NSS family neurotransmitter:Na+ symporter
MTANVVGPSVLWSSRLAVYAGTAGAAVGLGSIWRFPYLTGTGGGSAFILVFLVACVVIATPVLASEFALGRASRRSPPNAAAAIGGVGRLSSAWNAIGILGSAAAFLIFSYYSVIAGWVFAFAAKAATGTLSSAGPEHVADVWHKFRSAPLELGAWHAAFVLLVGVISARGLNRGIEVANKYRGPGLLTLLVVLAVYSLCTGDVHRGLAFAFSPNFPAIDTRVALSAIGQAFYATGVGQAMMIAYGAYIDRGTSLLHTSLVITGSILLVSILATLVIFPLVFGYGMSPAQGPQLVFEVLPRAFTEMPGGRVVGTLFFTLLVLAALMPSIALLEPTVAWAVERWGLRRPMAVSIVIGSAWLLGLGSVLSLNAWSSWYPLSFAPALANKTFFEALDYASSDILLPCGAVMTSVFVGWRLNRVFLEREFPETAPQIRTVCLWLLRLVCPLGILAVLVARFTT